MLTLWCLEQKMGANFYKKNFLKKLFTLGAKRENTPKKGPPKQRLLWGPLFFVPDTRGLEKI